MKYLANVTTLKYTSEKCAGCSRCVEVCPQGVFAMQDKRAVITDRDLCMECGACAMNCDFGAIAVHAGVGCAEAIINSILYGGEPSCDCTSSSNSCCG
jgi:NAD-dependent dihydropyrimidine dehydrogenase PreA subunit